MSPGAPGRDPGLQPERTALAWRRLGLALVVGGLVAVRVSRDVVGVAAGLAAAGAALLLLVLSHRDLAHHAASSGPPRSPFPQLALAGAATALLALAGAAVAFG